MTVLMLVIVVIVTFIMSAVVIVRNMEAHRKLVASMVISVLLVYLLAFINIIF